MLTQSTFTEEFGIYLQYVRKLGFEETPDYDFLRELFNKVLRRMGDSDDGVYDWMLLNNGKGAEVCTHNININNFTYEYATIDTRK